jgi:hypothetical protein
MKMFSKLVLPLLLFCQIIGAEIYEIQLTIENMVCPFCAESVVEDVKMIKGVETIQVWPPEGIGLVTWKQDLPFQSTQLFRLFASTQFILKQIIVDVEGVVERRRGSLSLRSCPDNSIFYIENGENLQVSKLEEGQEIRLRGSVTSQQGVNYMYVYSVMPPVE